MVAEDGSNFQSSIFRSPFQWLRRSRGAIAIVNNDPSRDGDD